MKFASELCLMVFFGFAFGAAGLTTNIFPGETRHGLLGGVGSFDYYTFPAASNDTVTILMAGPEGYTNRVFLELFAPGFKKVVERAGPLTAIIEAQKLNQTADYTILCTVILGEVAFPYGVTLIKNPGPNLTDTNDAGGTIAAGQTTTGSIDGPADIDVFSFSAIAGDTIAARMSKTGGSGTAPLVQLHAPDGTVLATASGDPSARLEVPCVKQTGTYLILCRDDRGTESFSYAVSLVQNPSTPVSRGTNQYLAVCECTNHMIVRWATNSAGFILESADTLPSTNWSAIGQTSNVIAGYYYLDVTAASGGRFYRLRRP